jgi:hypothetical protein
MGMDAEVIAIGHFGTLAELDVLDYDEKVYAGAHRNSTIIVTVAIAETEGQSKRLADLVCVEPWELWNHRVNKVLDPMLLVADDPIGGDRPEMIAAKIENLLACHAKVWFRPNG